MSWKFYPEQHHSDIMKWTRKALCVAITDSPLLKEKKSFTSKNTVCTGSSHDRIWKIKDKTLARGSYHYYLPIWWQLKMWKVFLLHPVYIYNEVFSMTVHGMETYWLSIKRRSGWPLFGSWKDQSLLISFLKNATINGAFCCRFLWQNSTYLLNDPRI